MNTSRPVVVGVDGSPSSRVALHHAVRLAERRGAPLHLVHAYQYPVYGYAMVGYVYPSDVSGETYRDAVEKDLQSQAEQLRAEHPDLVGVKAKQIQGTAAKVLLEQARTAEVTVLGSRGLGGFGGLLLGSVSDQVAAHARGPVVVTRGRTEGDGEHSDGAVAVGYDGSAGADPAVRFAADEAESRSVPLTIVRFYPPEVSGAGELAATSVGELSETLGRQHPSLELRPRTLPCESAANGLVELSEEHDLTVVGAHGHGGFPGSLIGSTGRILLHHARGPVAVVHPREHERSEP